MIVDFSVLNGTFIRSPLKLREITERHPEDEMRICEMPSSGHHVVIVIMIP